MFSLAGLACPKSSTKRKDKDKRQKDKVTKNDDLVSLLLVDFKKSDHLYFFSKAKSYANVQSLLDKFKLIVSIFNLSTKKYQIYLAKS